MAVAVRLISLLRPPVCLLFVVILAGTTDPVSAMTVRAPTFPELVAESASIVRGRVTEVSSRKVAGARGELIKTFVTFRVSTVLKGMSAGQEVTLAFLGGKVGDATLDVPGMPTFSVGAEDYLFVASKPGICPLVGTMHGRYRLITPQKPGRNYVAREDHEPLVQINDVVKPMRQEANSSALSDGSSALTPVEFEKLVIAEVAHPTRGVRQP
jgi:hypothetical protein